MHSVTQVEELGHKYNWSLDLEHLERYRSDMSHVSDDADSDVDNLINEKILSSSGNYMVSVAVQTDPVGDNVRRQYSRKTVETTTTRTEITDVEVRFDI